jgi:hypothetical protein
MIAPEKGRVALQMRFAARTAHASRDVQNFQSTRIFKIFSRRAIVGAASSAIETARGIHGADSEPTRYTSTRASASFKRLKFLNCLNATPVSRKLSLSLLGPQPFQGRLHFPRSIPKRRIFR